MGQVVVKHRKDHKWLESGRPTKKGVMVHPNQNPDGLLWGKVFMKSLMATPNALDVYYEPGFNSLRHSHPLDEIFYIFSGTLHVNGYDLKQGSVAFVPKNTMYGPEYTGDDGVYFIRVELWDTDTGRPDGTKGGEMGAGPTLRWWEGALHADGRPEAKQPDPAVKPADRSKKGALGALAANGNDKPWIESIQPVAGGTTEGKVFIRTLLSPTPNIVEGWCAPGVVRQHRSNLVDKLFLITDGELSIDGQKLTRGSVAFVPKNVEYSVEATSSNGARYVRAYLLDSDVPNPEVGRAPMAGESRPWAGPLTAEGLPDVRAA